MARKSWRYRELGSGGQSLSSGGAFASASSAQDTALELVDSFTRIQTPPPQRPRPPETNPRPKLTLVVPPTPPPVRVPNPEPAPKPVRAAKEEKRVKAKAPPKARPVRVANEKRVKEKTPPKPKKKKQNTSRAHVSVGAVGALHELYKAKDFAFLANAYKEPFNRTGWWLNDFLIWGAFRLNDLAVRLPFEIIKPVFYVPMAMGKSFARAVANPQYRKARLKANGRDFVWSAIAAAAVAAVPMLDTPVRANLESIAGYAGALNDEGPNLPDVAGLDVVGGALTALNAMREGDVEQNIQIQNARLQIGQENTITLVNDDSELALGRDHPLFASALEAKLGISIDINDVAGQVVFTPENAGEFSLDMLNSLLALGYEPLVQGYLNNAQYTEFEGEIFQHLPSIFRDDYIDGLLRSGGSYNACDGTVTLVDRLANQRVSDSVGFRERHPVTGLPADHFGTDIAVRRMRIPTMENGIVIFTGNIPGYGGTVIVDHGEGVRTLYAHFSAITVRRGQVVAEGDIVGISGNTGRGTGWHLHREVWVENPDQPGQWRVIDGEQYIGVDLGNPDTKRAAIAEVAAKLRDSVIERGMIQRASFH